MDPHYQNMLSKARLEAADLRKRLKVLASRKGLQKEVLRQAHRLHEEVFGEIDCLECANCCRELGPRILSPDIAPLAKALGLPPRQFEEEWIRLDEDGDKILKALPCPFLDGQVCAMYHDRPRSCRDYPHTADRDIHKRLHRLGLDLSYCPAAWQIARQLLTHFGI